MQDVRQQTKNETAGYNLRTVERAIQILSCVDKNNPEREISEIAKVVNLPKATTHRLVIALLINGYLERMHDEQKYCPGVRLGNIGARTIRRFRKNGVKPVRPTIFSQDELNTIAIFPGKYSLTFRIDAG